MARAGPPRVGRWGDSPESPPRAPPWWRCKVCHLSEGKRVTWGLLPETRPRAAAEGGRRCQLSLREWLSCCVAVSVLSEFCFFFLIVMIGKSVPLTACEATACCCGFALPLGRVIGAACPGGQEKVPLDSRKEKHEHSHNVCVRSPAANSGFAGKSVEGGGRLHFCLRVQQRPGASALGGWSPSPPGPSRGEGHGDRQGRPRGASAALRTCPCDEHGKISYDVVAEI